MGLFGSDVNGAFQKGYQHGLTNSGYRDAFCGDEKEKAAYRRGLRAGDRARERRLAREIDKRRRTWL